MTAPARRPASVAAAWLAMLALLVGVVGPAWGHLPAGHGTARASGWTEVCSAQGSRWVRVADPASDTPAHGLAAWLDHCADCLPLHDLPPPAAPVVAGTGFGTTGDDRALAPTVAPPRDDTARRPPPRGPPPRA